MVANLVSKMRPQNCQNLENILGKIGIFLLLNSNFPHTKFVFLQRLSNFLQQLSPFFNGFPFIFNGFPIFFNSFPLSSMAFCFLQRLSDFPQRLSSFSQRLSFSRNPRKSIYGKNYTKDHYLSFVFFATRSPTRAPSFVIPATKSHVAEWLSGA